LATILKDGNPSDPAQLWADHQTSLCDDVLLQLQRRSVHPIHNPTPADVLDYGLYLLH